MARIPQFGDWDNTNNGPISMCFEKARKEKAEGKPLNSNGTRKTEEVQRHNKPANIVASALPSQEKMKQPQDGGLRSRPKPVAHRNQIPPPFGEWDDPSTAAAGGYTAIFNDIRKPKNDDTKNVPVFTVNDSSNHGGNKDDQNVTCFRCFTG